MVAYSIPLYLPTLIGIPLGQLYYSILARSSSNWELGNLGVAGNVMAPINSVGGAILASLLSSLPMLSSDREGMLRVVERSLIYTSLIMPALAGWVIVVSEPLITIFYGPSYSLSPLYVTVMALGVMLAPLGSYVWGSYLASIGRTDEIFKAQVIGAILGPPIYIALILSAGVIGYLAAGIIVSAITTTYMLRVATSLGVKANLRDSFRMMTPTILALTASTPTLVAIESSLARWLLAPAVYTATLAIVTPVIVGPETLNSIASTMRKAGFIGALIATMINLDVRVAEKIWGMGRA